MTDTTALETARTLIGRRLGFELGGHRSDDLERALECGRRASDCSTLTAFVEGLRQQSEGSSKWKRLIADLTVGETHFFRDRSTFDALENRILSDLIVERRQSGVLRLRLWSAGCATGEEAYSLAIILHRLLLDRSQWAITILATDLNERALEAARRGVYRRWSLREADSELLERYFIAHGPDAYQVRSEIRRMVSFAPLNLAGSSYPDVATDSIAMDVILCRNVLMYFSRAVQEKVVGRLQQALLPHGWLIVSAAEGSPDLLRPLAQVHFSDAIAYRKQDGDDDGCFPVSPRTSTLETATNAFPAAAESAFDESSTAIVATQPVAEVGPAPEGVYVQLPTPDCASESPFNEARRLADLGQLEQARDVCRRALAGNRLDPEGHLLAAAIFQELGDVRGALESVSRALYLQPDMPLAHFAAGTLHLRCGNGARGRRHLQTVIDLLADHALDETLSYGDGFTADRVIEIARTWMETHA